MKVGLVVLALCAPGAAFAAEDGSCPVSRAGFFDGLGDLVDGVRDVFEEIFDRGPDRPSTPPCTGSSDRGDRVLDYNIKAGRDSSLEDVAADIRAMNAGLVTLQEVDVGTSRTGEVNQPAELSRRTGLRYNAFAKAIDHDGGEYGVAILSKWPITNVQRFPLPGEGEKRVLLCATVKAPSGDMQVCNTHLGLTDDAREDQVDAILEILRTRIPGGVDGRVMLTGDFNMPPGDPNLEKLLDAGLSDAWSAGEGNGYSHPSGRPTRRIDFVLTGGGFGGATCAVVPEVRASDHRPVFTTID